MQGYSQGDAVASVEHNTLIAGCFSDVKGGPEAAEANARLIAAAPDLLEALISLVRERANGHQGSLSAAETTAYVAIAKAEGK